MGVNGSIGVKLMKVTLIIRAAIQKAVMLSSVEAWRAGICALPFDSAQGDTPLLIFFSPLKGSSERGLKILLCTIQTAGPLRETLRGQKLIPK